MATKREIEAKGPDVETAINNGLAQLGLKRNDVIVEVLDEGSRGLLGIGARDAVVRLTGDGGHQPAAPAKTPTSNQDRSNQNRPRNQRRHRSLH
jgi:spoIIIJ-associated protein